MAVESAPDKMFRSLVERSITDWRSLNYVGLHMSSYTNDGATVRMNMVEMSQADAISKHAKTLRSHDSLDAVLQSGEFWFFQLRKSFMRQKEFMKWDANCLDEYILLPIDYGYANNRDCFFVSHYWRTEKHPDPQGLDLRLVQGDLANQEWAYVWVDWTCMPQAERSEAQKIYFKKMLRCIPMLIRDCAFSWRFPAFEPRAWILYEVAEFFLNHKFQPTDDLITDDVRPFVAHLGEMIVGDVRPVIDKYGYKCTNKSDERLVIGWMEILVILNKVVPNVSQRQEIFDWINKGEVGKMSIENLGVTIDKAKGVISCNGTDYKFNPVYLYGVTPTNIK